MANMTTDQLTAIMGRNSLTVPHLETLLGVSRRTVFYWLAGNPIPQPVAMVLMAFDEGHLTENWLADTIASLAK